MASRRFLRDVRVGVGADTSGRRGEPLPRRAVRHPGRGGTGRRRARGRGGRQQQRQGTAVRDRAGRAEGGAYVSVRIVVGGALLHGGRLLAARRTAPPELAGRWELPGGKVEAGERPEQALVRELREELGVTVRPVERVPGEWGLPSGHVLVVWRAELLRGTPRALQDH